MSAASPSAAVLERRAAEGAATRTRRSTRETILQLAWLSPALLSLQVTRDPGFRFTPGHYARIGLAGLSGEPVFRPLSIASAPADPHLEFLCTLVPDGELSTRLAACRVGDRAEVDKASYGFLTLDGLAPGSELWLLASGTGLAPYLSMLRDPRAWKAFDRLIVAHSVRRASELAYAGELEHLARDGPGGEARGRLTYLPIVTREPGATALAARIPALVSDGRLESAAGMALDPAHSRVMACGNPDMTRELRALLGERGFRTARRGAPGQVAFEKYW
jgi:ferredoxin--NADP+ reductase